jgi:hypothetical protein
MSVGGFATIFVALTVQGYHGTDIGVVASLFITCEGRESVTLINVHDKYDASRLMTTLDC